MIALLAAFAYLLFLLYPIAALMALAHVLIVREGFFGGKR